MALEGSLQDMPLEDLIEIAQAGKRTGRLTMVRADERGEITLVRGQIADAAVYRWPDQHLIAADDEAVIRLFGWADAQFTVEQDTSVEEHRIRVRTSVPMLRAEAARRAKPAQAIAVDLDTWLELGAAPTGTVPLLSVEEWRLLVALTRRATLRAACFAAGLPPFTMVSIAQNLLQHQLIRLAQAPIVPQPGLWQKPQTTDRLIPRPGTNSTLVRAIIKRVSLL